MDGDKRNLSKEEYEAIAHQELLKLERDFRKMLSDREAVSKKTKTILANQRKVIKILEKEKEELLSKIEFQSKSKVHDDEEQKTVKEVIQLLKEFEAIEQKKKEKVQQLDDVKTSVKGMMEKIDAIKQSRKTELRDYAKEEKIEEQLKGLLREEAGKFDQAVTETKKLREEADHFLYERIKFNKMVEELVNELSSGKKMIFDLIEQSEIAYETRQYRDLQMTTLHGKVVKDFGIKIKEVWEANQAVEHGNNLNKFIEAKSKQRKLTGKTSVRVEEEAIVRNQLIGKLNSYENIINQIVKTFNEKNLDKLILEFRKIEEDNFNICSFLSEQNARTNSVENEVKELENAVVMHRELNQTIQDEQSAVLKKYKNDYWELMHELKLQENYSAELRMSLEDIMVGIKEIFDDIQCNWEPFLAFLGPNKDHVVVENVEPFLVAIEQRLQLITTYLSLIMDKPVSKRMKRMTIKSPTQMQPSASATVNEFVETTLPDTPCPLCVEVLDSSDKTEIVMPLKLDEIKPLVEEERRKGRWHAVMHTLAECPLPIAQRIMQKKRNAS